MRHWMLWAAPAMVACGLRWHAGGAAAGMALWLLMGHGLGRRNVYPYPRKRKSGHRLFFAAGLCALCLNCAVRELTRLVPGGPVSPLAALLIYAGAAGVSLAIGERSLLWPLPRRAAYGMGALLWGLFGLLAG